MLTEDIGDVRAGTSTIGSTSQMALGWGSTSTSTESMSSPTAGGR